MPTMTLRRAAQVYNRINAETQFELEPEDDDPYAYRRRRRGPKKQTLQVTATVSVDGNPREQTDQLRTDLLSKKEQMFRLMKIGTNIRRECALKQADCGVSALVTERVAVVQQQKILDALLKAVETSVYDSNFVMQQATALRERLAIAGQGSTTATITTPLLTVNDRAALRTELAETRRRLLEIDDRLAELNSSNSITATTNEDDKFLRELGIA